MYKEIGCFDDLMDYLTRIGNQYGFTMIEPVARKISKLVSDDPAYIRYNRRHGTITVIGCYIHNWTYYKGRDKISHGFDYAVINPHTLETVKAVSYNTFIDFLPHGSGIDGNWHFELLTNGRIVAHNSYHAMDQWGGYWGWIDFSATLQIDPQFGTISLINVRNHADYVPSFLGGHREQADYLYQTIEGTLCYNQP